MKLNYRLPARIPVNALSNLTRPQNKLFIQKELPLTLEYYSVCDALAGQQGRPELADRGSFGATPDAVERHTGWRRPAPLLALSWPVPAGVRDSGACSPRPERLGLLGCSWVAARTLG